MLNKITARSSCGGLAFFLLTTLVQVFTCITLTSCSTQEEKRIVIWTSDSEFAPYIEYYNELHKEKAILVYKENPQACLPPKNGELAPDIVIGPWLKNEKTRKYFTNLNYMFDRKYIRSYMFYKELLDYGKIYHSQYLLPVSFNLPLVIFSPENSEWVHDNYTISLDNLREWGKAYNKQNKNGSLSRIGFASQSNDSFLYLVSKLKGTDYKLTKGKNFSWNQEKLDYSVNYIKECIQDNSTKLMNEADFVYKYLSETDDKRVHSGRTLFAYTTSDKFFKYSTQSLEKLDYRWICDNGIIPIEDNNIMCGIYKKSHKINLASNFISWFFDTKTQQALLDRKTKLHLTNTKFGIAEGFSSVKEVNEYILPVFYTKFLSNIPNSNLMKLYEPKPYKWNEIKKRIIIPYIKEHISQDENKKTQTIQEKLQDFERHENN